MLSIITSLSELVLVLQIFENFVHYFCRF